MAKSLVIVESPAKAKTIGKYLGKDFVVKASLGHVKDLPKKDLNVDVDHNFEPHYEVIEGKKKLIAELKAAAKAAKSSPPHETSGEVFIMDPLELDHRYCRAFAAAAFGRCAARTTPAPAHIMKALRKPIL